MIRRGAFDGIDLSPAVWIGRFDDTGIYRQPTFEGGIGDHIGIPGGDQLGEKGVVDLDLRVERSWTEQGRQPRPELGGDIAFPSQSHGLVHQGLLVDGETDLLARHRYRGVLDRELGRLDGEAGLQILQGGDRPVAVHSLEFHVFHPDRLDDLSLPQQPRQGEPDHHQGEHG